MEDIKVLEEYIKEREYKLKTRQEILFKQAIENLIKRNKELEVENLELLEKIEMKKILIMRKDHTTKEIFGELYIKKDDLEKDYIPKSKVREVRNKFDEMVQKMYAGKKEITDHDVFILFDELLEGDK